MNGRYLIVSADDFGLNSSTNDAIAELFSSEHITSAGILAPASKAGEACRMAAQHGWSVGVHLSLIHILTGKEAVTVEPVTRFSGHNDWVLVLKNH